MKRRLDVVDDSEDLSFGRQALPVADLYEDFDGVARNGMEYLFIVRRDARKLPHITRAINPYERAEWPSSPPSDSPHPTSPREEWRASFHKHFKNFRKNAIQPTIHVSAPEKSPGQIVPDKLERDLWWAFIEGKPKVYWCTRKQSKANKKKKSKMRAFSENDSDDQDHVGETGQARPTGSLRVSQGGSSPHHPPLDVHVLSTLEENDQVKDTEQKPREPTPALLNHVDHRMSMRLLKIFTHWIHLCVQEPDSLSVRVTDVHARWIFALLSRIDDYATADEISALRELARACLALLSCLRSGVAGGNSTAVMRESSCWFVIAAVVSIWGQQDLWSEANSMLSKTDLNIVLPPVNALCL